MSDGLSPTVLSCFSGVGGLDLGLEAAGFETVGCLELDAEARRSLTANRPGWSLLSPADVVDSGRTLRPEDLGMQAGDLTLIAGGPPCQPFSKAAQWASPKRGVEDGRGTAVGGMLDLIESFLPQAVMMENVSGFLSGANNAAPLIKQALAGINARNGTQYRLGSWIVDAADYGVAQHRRRAIVLALRDTAILPSTLPSTHAGRHRTAWDALGGVEPDDALPATGKYADLLPSIPEGENYQYLTAQGAGPESEIFGYRTRFWSFLLKLAKNRPSWTLSASPGPSTGPFHWSNRPLTSSERKLLQGFPNSWKLVENERSNVRLVGNATPPPLAEALGRYLLCRLRTPDLDPEAQQILPTLATPSRITPAPPPAEVQALPERWRKQVGSVAAHPGAGQGPAAHIMQRSIAGDSV